MGEIKLHNIFAKSKQQTKKAMERQKVIIDYREKNSLVASELMHLGIEIEFKELKVGDYLVNNIAIERKTVSDFISSMVNGRLRNQLQEMQQYENRLLLIEGVEEQELYSEDSDGVNPNSIRGFLLSISLKYKVPILFTKDYSDTAKFIYLIAIKKETETPLNVSKKSFNKKEQLQFIIESFPGVGPKTAKKLLEKFKSIKGIINSPLEDLQKEIGKKADVFKLVEEEY